MPTFPSATLDLRAIRFDDVLPKVEQAVNVSVTLVIQREKISDRGVINVAAVHFHQNLVKSVFVFLVPEFDCHRVNYFPNYVSVS